MANDLFGGFEGREEEIESFKKRDVSKHVQYLKVKFLNPDGTWNHKKQITLPMDMGEPVELKNKEGRVTSVRGRNELDNEERFREAAKELRIGIRFGEPTYSRDGNGNPIAELRFTVVPIKEFSDEAVNLRVLAQAVRLAQHWQGKPDSEPDVDVKRKEAKARLDSAVADARRLNTDKTRDALKKYGISVTAPVKK